eukprot:TRINITY_DN458_c0_g5_i1.p1 TRINITY_DN458_c0_g5~~TRINITY_DN458_c0_g5_i1.p1  ORF type:complete len:557 (-),score=137.25 TRINITY_DN458_c0_g5_i1:59-1729(-)
MAPVSLTFHDLLLAGAIALALACQPTWARKPAKFLGRRSLPRNRSAAGAADLLAELERLDRLGDFDHAAVTAARAANLEPELKPLFDVAPRTANGEVDAKAARYLLHRLFVQRHGWFVNGVELQSLPTDSKVGDALESGERFTLPQLARFAAVLETLVHVENVERLQKAFAALRLPRNAPRGEEAAKKVIEAYLVFFIGNYVPADASYIYARALVEQTYLSWKDTLAFAEGLLQDVLARQAQQQDEGSSLWDLCLLVVQELGEQYGRWQNKDCMELKSTLLKIETPGTGRVPLTDFWAPMLKDDQAWLFDESVPYLEQLGALEGSEPPHQSVVIPNYILSAGNCLASSKYYDVCCISECEAILGEIETRVAAPSATPERLADLVSGIASSTTTAPRRLPAELAGRLDAIAAQHGGLVPLHGRLFLQFLHHAYPRECPYPRKSVSQPAERPEFWISRQASEAKVTKEEIAKYMNVDAMHNFTSRSSGGLPWSDEEDLFMNNVWLDDAGDDVTSDEASLFLQFLGLLLVLAALAFKFHEPIFEGLGMSVKPQIRNVRV